MNRLINSVLLFIGSLVFTSCENVFIKPVANNPIENFDLFWQSLDDNYSHFEVAGVDWDLIYATYRPQIDMTTSDRKLFDILNEITQALKDSHVNVYSPLGSTRYDFSKGFPENSNIFARDYLTKMITVNNVSYGILKNSNLGYLGISSFTSNNECCSFDEALKTLGNTDGLVIDVRSNGGGSDRIALNLISRLIEEKKQYSWVRYRNGKKRTDFTEWVPNYASPEGSLKYLKPIVVLINRKCISSCEGFVLMMKAIPGTVTIGGATGGGSGNPIGRELPNGWTFRVPVWQQADVNKQLFEGRGLSPDVSVTITKADSTLRKDTILEKAIEVLN